ncbi:MAG: pyridoxal phosphate-dependent aminotransferase [Candidatus Hydrothermae bacterium]|nr:pyridoxal phosphate-dependent aminotransferase [Candidatus Hydrothermae bacterium]
MGVKPFFPTGRATAMPASPIRRLQPFANEAKRRGIQVYHLNIGQPDIPTPESIFKAMHSYSEKVLAYGPSEGLKPLRETISRYFSRYGIEISAEEVFITTGGSEAILFVMMTIADPGDEIIVVEPFYTNYKGFAVMSGVRLVPVSTSVENGFHLPPPEEFEKKITGRTRAILIASPNNPTGTIYTEEEIRGLADICRRRGLFLIADEVYREFTFDGKKHFSVLEIEDFEEKAIVVDSISKRFSACGARIGFIATRNRELLKYVLKFGQARLCPPTMEQMGAIAGFENMDEFLNDTIREYEARRDVVFDEIKKIDGAFTLKPEGAFYTVVKLPVENAETFAEWMLRDFSLDGKTTMVAPAEDFYATPGKGKDEIRIAYVLEREKLRDAMRILREGLEAFLGKGGR